MKLKTTLWIIGAVLLLSLIPTGLLSYQNWKLKKEKISLAGQVTISEKRLSDSLLRADTERTDELSKLREQAEEHGSEVEKIERDLRSLGATLEAVAQTSAQTESVVHNHYSSTSTTQSKAEVPVCSEDGRPIDIHGYTKRVETVNLEDSNGMRVADISFAAAEKAPWTSKVYGLTYKINNTIGRSEGGQIVLYTELLAQNPEAQPGEIFRIEGIESRVLQAPEPGPQFSWWDPRIYLGTGLGVGVYPDIEFSASLNLGFSPFSYDNLSVLGIFVGYDAFNNSFLATLHPVLYNVGAHIPLVSSIFLSVFIGIDHTSEVSVGMGVSTRL
jgi:hypothetical protein